MVINQVLNTQKIRAKRSSNTNLTVLKNDGKITIMVLGADKEQGGISRTDSIMIAQYDYIHKNEDDVCHARYLCRYTG